MAITVAHPELDDRRSLPITTPAAMDYAGEKTQVRATIGAVSTPPWPAPPARPRTWPAYAISAIAIVLAVVALFTRPAAPVAPPAPSAPTHSAADTSAAQQHLCDSYQLAARAARTDTAGTDQALARTSLTNGALMLETAAADPALDGSHRDAARALSAAYQRMVAVGAKGVTTDAEYQAAVDDGLAKDAAMKAVCGG